MNIDEYSLTEHARYAALAEAVAAILTAAIENEDRKLKFQPIQRRAKDPVSLRDKIQYRAISNPERIEEDIKDLAGCRVIFYTNGDALRFLNSGIIHANFVVDPIKTKYHHPVPKEGEAPSQFRSRNIVVSFNKTRMALPEYAQFVGMLCEVQVQTILNHAWSETSHDIIYKEPKLNGHGKKLLANLRQRIDAIMTKYLLPAGYELQNVWDDYQKLLAGKELFDGDALKLLVVLDNNNDRSDLLTRIDEYILPQLDDYATSYPPIREKIVESVKVALKTPVKPIKYPGGNFDGISHDFYIDQAFTMLEKLQYQDIAGTIDSIFELFDEAENDTQRERIIKAARAISEHNLNIWKQVGPYVESFVEKNELLPMCWTISGIV